MKKCLFNVLLLGLIFPSLVFGAMRGGVGDYKADGSVPMTDCIEMEDGEFLCNDTDAIIIKDDDGTTPYLKLSLDKVEGGTNGEYIDFATDDQFDFKDDDGSIYLSITQTDIMKSGALDIDVSGVLTLDSGGGQIYLEHSGVTSVRQYTNTATDEFLFGVADSIGNQFVLTNVSNFFKDHDHPVQDNPTNYNHSDTDVNNSNQEYGAKTHDKDDVVYTSGHGGHKFTIADQSAKGTMSLTGIPVADETFVINATTITAKADGSGDIDHFTIGADAAGTVTNIVATLAECTEAANQSAWDGAGDTIVIEWLTAGVAGNSIVLTEAMTNTAADGSGTLGGTHVGVAAFTQLDVGTTINEIATPLRGATSLWYRALHVCAFSADAGASGATFVTPSVDTLGGYQLDAVGEALNFGDSITSMWDGSTDLEVKITWEVNVDNSGGNVGDTVDLQLLPFYKGNADTVCKTQILEEVVTVGQSAQYKRHTTTFTIDWDATDNIVEVADKMTFILNLETDTSEVDNVIVNAIVFRYKTAKVHVEI